LQPALVDRLKVKSPFKLVSNYFAERKDKLQLAELYTQFFPNYVCSKQILLMGKAYRNYFYRCAITVDAREVLEYLRAYDEQGQGYIRGRNVWHQRLCLIDWLEQANEECEAVTMLDKNVRDYIHSHLDRLLTLSSVKIYCPECKKNYAKPTAVRGQAKLHSGWNAWTEMWQCDEGHTIYSKKQQVHIYKGN